MTHRFTMFSWIRALFAPPQAIGPPRLIRSFSPGDPPSNPERLTIDHDSWHLDCRGHDSLTLFKIRDPGVGDCLLTFRAELRCAELRNPACLELQAHLPGRRLMSSKGFHHAFQGNHDWHIFETSLTLRGARRPDLLKLNIATEGPGSIWIRSVKVLATAVE